MSDDNTPENQQRLIELLRQEKMSKVELLKVQKDLNAALKEQSREQRYIEAEMQKLQIGGAGLWRAPLLHHRTGGCGSPELRARDLPNTGVSGWLPLPMSCLETVRSRNAYHWMRLLSSSCC